MRVTELFPGFLAAFLVFSHFGISFARRSSNLDRDLGHDFGHDHGRDLPPRSADPNSPGGWAGVVYTSLPIGHFTAVQATITVPTPSIPIGGVLPDPIEWPDQDWVASAWVGIDGATHTKVLLKAGIILHIKPSGKIHIEPVYGWYPNRARKFESPELSISVGDVITMRVETHSPTSGTATIENKTTGKSVSHQVSDPKGSFPLASENAEWIVENPIQDGIPAPFANFGSITFTDAIAYTDSNWIVGPGNVDAHPYAIPNVIRRNDGASLTDLETSGHQMTVTYTPAHISGGDIAENGNVDLTHSISASKRTSDSVKRLPVYHDGWAGAVIESPPSGSFFTSISSTILVGSTLDYIPNRSALISVGLGGVHAEDLLLQVGVIVTSIADPTTPSYTAFYEWAPRGLRTFPDFPVRACDTITLRVESTNQAKATATIENETTGRRHVWNITTHDSNATLACKSAQWTIQRAPSTLGDGFAPLVDFNRVYFDEVEVRTNTGQVLDASGARVYGFVQDDGNHTLTNIKNDTVTVDYVWADTYETPGISAHEGVLRHKDDWVCLYNQPGEADAFAAYDY